MDKLDTPRAILLGLTLVALAIVAAGFLGPRTRYALIKWGDGPRFMRLDSFTGEGVWCAPRYGQFQLECPPQR